MIAKEGRIILIILLAFFFPFGIYAHASNLIALHFLYYIFGFFYLFTVYFFRNPQRKIPNDNSAVVSPADGKIVSIKTINDSDIGEFSQVISIFLSLFDVHAFRYPHNGTVKSVNRKKGKFIAAFNDQASNQNERVVTVVEADSFTYKVTQIAGLIARRILCYAVPNQLIKKGDRMGFIRFGSRADIVVPSNINICVNVGQKVKAGESIIARTQQ
tara:strand:+ start:4672 stop:5316 length:645 start_codon:yes stop_codon:yes gene_type:complete